MSIKKILAGSLALAICTSAAGFSAPTPDAMRGSTATQINSRLASSVSLTKDANANIISFHVNGVSPSDAQTLLAKSSSPLSSEFTVITGENREGASSTYMLPTDVATAQVVEGISRELVNGGAISLQITKQTTGKS